MKQKKGKQIAAILCIIAMVLVYVAAFIAAIVDQSSSGFWFKMAILATIVFPVLTWFYIWVYGVFTGKKTIADLHLMQEEDVKNRNQGKNNDKGVTKES